MRDDAGGGVVGVEGSAVVVVVLTSFIAAKRNA